MKFEREKTELVTRHIAGKLVEGASVELTIKILEAVIKHTF